MYRQIIGLLKKNDFCKSSKIQIKNINSNYPLIILYSENCFIEILIEEIEKYASIKMHYLGVAYCALTSPCSAFESDFLTSKNKTTLNYDERIRQYRSASKKNKEIIISQLIIEIIKLFYENAKIQFKG